MKNLSLSPEKNRLSSPKFRDCLSVCVEIDIFGTIQERKKLHMLPKSRSASYRSLARAKKKNPLLIIAAKWFFFRLSLSAPHENAIHF